MLKIRDKLSNIVWLALVVVVFVLVIEGKVF